MIDESGYKSGTVTSGDHTPDGIQQTGGLGALQGETHKTSDAKLIGRAIRERWNIPPEVLDRLPLKALQIATDPTSRKREQIQAMKLLGAMHASNQDADVQCNRMDRLDENKPTEIIEFAPIELRVSEKV